MTELVTSRDLEIKPSSNLIKYSHTFTNIIWSKVSTVITGQPDPFGGNNAALIVFDSTNLYGNMTQNITMPIGTYTLSFFAKVHGGITRHITVTMPDGINDGPVITWNLSNGAIGSSVPSKCASLTGGIVPMREGWVRCYATFINCTAVTGIRTWPKQYSGEPGDNRSGIYVYGYQLEEGTKLSGYIPTSASVVSSGKSLVSASDTNYAVLGDLDEVQVTNLVNYSELLTGWGTNCTITVNAINDPFGNLTACKATTTTGTFVWQLYQLNTITPLTNYYVQFYAKAGEEDTIILANDNTEANYYNLITATKTAGALGTTSIVSVGNGWCKITCQFKSSAICSNALSFRIRVNGNFTSTNGGLYLWGIHCAPQTTPITSYTKTTGSPKYAFGATPLPNASLPDIPVLPAPSLRLDFTTGVLDPRISLTRSTSATRTNIKGILETVGANVARFNYDPVTRKCKGLLLEEARTNIIQNGDCSGSVNGVLGGTGLLPTYWGMAQQPTGLSYEVISSGVEAGIKYIDFRIYGTPSISNHPLLGLGFIALNSSTTYSMSAYLKVISGNPTQVGFGFGGGTGGNDGLGIVIPTTTLTRYSGTGPTSTGVTNLAPWIHFYTTQGVAYDFTIRIGYVQLEAGPGATSYIPTISGAVARDADYCLLTTAGWLKYDVGTVISKFDGGLDSTQNGYGRVISPNGAYTVLSGNGAFTNIGNWAGVGGTNVTIPRSSYSDKVLAGASWDNTGVSLAASGIQGSSFGYSFLAWSNTTWTLGGNSGSRGNMLNGHIESIDYYPIRLNNTVLTAMTASYKVIGSGATNKLLGEVTDLRPKGSNLVGNSEFLGANGATLPTNWSFNGNPGNTLLGITATFTRGSYQGYEGMFVRYKGTASGTGELALSNYGMYADLINTWSAIIVSPCFVSVRVYAARLTGVTPTGGQHFNIVGRNKFGTLSGDGVGTYDIPSVGVNVTECVAAGNFTNPITEVLGFKLNFLVNTGEVVDTVMFYSRPQINIGPIGPYIPTGIGDNSYGRISSSTAAKKSEVSDLVRLISSTVTYLADLVKSFASLKVFSKNRSVPNLVVSKAATTLEAEHVKPVFNSRNRPTYDTEARLTPVYEHTPEPSQFTRPTQDNQFESPTKSFIFNKEP